METETITYVKELVNTKKQHYSNWRIIMEMMTGYTIFQNSLTKVKCLYSLRSSSPMINLRLVCPQLLQQSNYQERQVDTSWLKFRFLIVQKKVSYLYYTPFSKKKSCAQISNMELRSAFQYSFPTTCTQVSHLRLSTGIGNFIVP